MADLPKPYRGTLTVAAIAEGMNIATANATRLARDARLLLESERWPTAASVAALSIEESGKVVILRRFLLAKKEAIPLLWKEYRSHTKKNLNWILPDLVAQGARSLEDFRPIVDGESDHPQVLDTLKQLGFYTDCIGEAHWSVPSDVVDEALARSLVSTAELLAPDRKISVRELELWIKHLGPVWKKNNEWMKEALADWFAEMQAEGLAPAGPNKMRAFVKHGLTITQSEQLKGK